MMTAASESEEIRRSLKPIFTSSWIFGVPRVSYKFSYRLIYSVIVTVIYVGTFAETIDEQVKLFKNFNSAMVILFVISQLVIFGGVIGTIGFWIAKGAQSLEDAITELADLDVDLKLLGIKIEHHDVICRQIVLLTVFVVLWGIIAITYEVIINNIGANAYFTTLTIFCISYSTNVSHLLTLFGELVFSTIMHTFYKRFQWINQALRESWKNNEDYDEERALIVTERNVSDLSTRKVISTEALLLTIEHLYKSHQRLCKITEKVNIEFSSQLFFGVSATFSLLVYRLTILYTQIFKNFSQSLFSIALTIVWVIFYILKFWTITLTCYHTSAEANKLGIMLHGIEINDLRYHRMLQVYSIQLSQNKLKFTAGGFFPIDLSLVSALFSTVTTYIIVAVDVWTDTTAQYNTLKYANLTAR